MRLSHPHFSWMMCAEKIGRCGVSLIHSQGKVSVLKDVDVRSVSKKELKGKKRKKGRREKENPNVRREWALRKEAQTLQISWNLLRQDKFISHPGFVDPFDRPCVHLVRSLIKVIYFVQTRTNGNYQLCIQEVLQLQARLWGRHGQVISSCYHGSTRIRERNDIQEDCAKFWPAVSVQWPLSTRKRSDKYR